MTDSDSRLDKISEYLRINMAQHLTCGFSKKCDRTGSTVTLLILVTVTFTRKACSQTMQVLGETTKEGGPSISDTGVTSLETGSSTQKVMEDPDKVLCIVLGIHSYQCT